MQITQRRLSDLEFMKRENSVRKISCSLSPSTSLGVERKKGAESRIRH